MVDYGNSPPQAARRQRHRHTCRRRCCLARNLTIDFTPARPGRHEALVQVMGVSRTSLLGFTPWQTARDMRPTVAGHTRGPSPATTAAHAAKDNIYGPKQNKFSTTRSPLSPNAGAVYANRHTNSLSCECVQSRNKSAPKNHSGCNGVHYRRTREHSHSGPLPRRRRMVLSDPTGHAPSP